MTNYSILTSGGEGGGPYSVGPNTSGGGDPRLRCPKYEPAGGGGGGPSGVGPNTSGGRRGIPACVAQNTNIIQSIRDNVRYFSCQLLTLRKLNFASLFSVCPTVR